MNRRERGETQVPLKLNGAVLRPLRFIPTRRP
jgi:hypothetical protein